MTYQDNGRIGCRRSRIALPTIATMRGEPVSRISRIALSSSLLVMDQTISFSCERTSFGAPLKFHAGGTPLYRNATAAISPLPQKTLQHCNGLRRTAPDSAALPVRPAVDRR